MDRPQQQFAAAHPTRLALPLLLFAAQALLLLACYHIYHLEIRPAGPPPSPLPDDDGDGSHSSSSSSFSPTVAVPPPPRKKVILLATKFFDSHSWYIRHPSLEFCPVSSCEVLHIEDVKYEEERGAADAVVFHPFDMAQEQKDDNYLEISKWRRPQQRFVMYEMECPIKMYQEMGRRERDIYFSRQEHFFNWTMTYRRDSDVFSPFGAVLPREAWPLGAPPQTPPSKGSREESLEDSRSVLWLVSNCGGWSDRERYVWELSRHTQVDIVGDCSQVECERSTGCEEDLFRTHNFYLAFENAICHEYVTEKFFKALARDIVPVVMGGADYESLAPPHSFIDATSFSSPKELAKHLKHLERNPKEYRKYFEWKDSNEYSVMEDDGWDYLGLCNLCEALHDETLPPKSYKNVNDWLNAGGSSKGVGVGGRAVRACRNRGTFPWSRLGPRSIDFRQRRGQRPIWE